jgi:hypothetical protein
MNRWQLHDPKQSRRKMSMQHGTQIDCTDLSRYSAFDRFKLLTSDQVGRELPDLLLSLSYRPENRKFGKGQSIPIRIRACSSTPLDKLQPSKRTVAHAGRQAEFAVRHRMNTRDGITVWLMAA